MHPASSVRAASSSPRLICKRAAPLPVRMETTLPQELGARLPPLLLAAAESGAMVSTDPFGARFASAEPGFPVP